MCTHTNLHKIKKKLKDPPKGCLWASERLRGTENTSILATLLLSQRWLIRDPERSQVPDSPHKIHIQGSFPNSCCSEDMTQVQNQQETIKTESQLLGPGEGRCEPHCSLAAGRFSFPHLSLSQIPTWPGKSRERSVWVQVATSAVTLKTR